MKLGQRKKLDAYPHPAQAHQRLEDAAEHGERHASWIARATMQSLIKWSLAAETVERRRAGVTFVAALTAQGHAKILASKRLMQGRLAKHSDLLPTARLWLALRWDAQVNP